MDTKLLGLMAADAPVANIKVCTGLSYHQMKYAKHYLENRWQSAAESFPEGLKYCGGVQCTPEEQFVQVAKKNKKTYDMSPSDVVLMKYRFEWHGEFLKDVYILIPFVSPGGVIKINGAIYRVTPVIGGKIFNIEKGSIFMPIPKNRSLVFNSIGHMVSKNNKALHCQVYHSPLHHFSNPKMRSKHKGLLIHYMLAEYGLSRCLRLLFNIDIEVGYEELDGLYNTHNVYKTKSISKVRKNGKITAVESRIRIAVPLSQDRAEVDSVIASIYYIIDQYPLSVQVEDVDNPELWLRLLDRFIFSEPTIDKKGLDHLNAHLSSVKGMFDNATRKTLKEENIHCDNTFELFRYIMYNFNDIVQSEDSGSMYGKELAILKYFLYNIVYSINEFVNMITKIPLVQLDAKKISKAFDNVRIYSIFSLKNHGELMPESIVTDFMPHSATCNMVSRSKAASGGRSKRQQRLITDPHILLHPSQVEVSTYGWITKAESTGRGKTNPFVYFSREFVTDQRHDTEEKMKRVAARLYSDNS